MLETKESPLTLTQRAHKTLREMIMDNRLRAGESYLEQELAEKLGISRTPVREAGLRLAEEGFVQIRRRLGMLVLPVSSKDMAEIYDILTELEPYAARRLAERGVSEETRRELEDAVERMERALKDRDLDAWAAADRHFHRLLVRRAENWRLERFVSTLWDQVHRARMATLNVRSDLSKSNEDHRELVRLILAGDAKAAERLHRRHRARAGKALITLLKKRGGEL